MSRFRIFLLFTALAALATTFAACGGGDDNGDPQQVLDDATLAGVESGALELSLGIDAEGEEGGEVEVALSGPFQSKGSESLPEFDFEASAKGEVEGDEVDFEGGLTVLSNRAFIGYEGSEYEVDPTTFGFVKSGFEQAAQEGSGEEEEGFTACQEAAEEVQVRDFVDNLGEQGDADVAGTSTTKVSGDLNVGGAIDAIIELTENPACGSQLEAAGPLPTEELEEARGELTEAVEKAHVDVYVGEDDILRRIDAEATIEPQGGGDKVEFALELTLSGVDEQQSISAPGNAKPLEELFRGLGVNPLELFEAGSSGDVEGLLEQLLEADGGSGGGGSGSGGSPDGSSGGGPGDGGSSGGGADAGDYLGCLENAQTPADLQKCADLRG